VMQQHHAPHPSPACVHSNIWSPLELPNAACGRRPMMRLTASGLPALSWVER